MLAMDRVNIVAVEAALGTLVGQLTWPENGLR